MIHNIRNILTIVLLWQIFPINMKGKAGSLVVLVAWLGAWIVSYTYNFLMSWNAPGRYFKKRKSFSAFDTVLSIIK